MRLLNTTSLELKEFHGDAVPPYAILSHTWVDGEEASFRDFVDMAPSFSTATTKSGFRKIQGACRVARQDAIDWIWIDTNCIDKASSAELTEAINSMYNWYRGSKVCYAYLADVPRLGGEDGEEEERERERDGGGGAKKRKGGENGNGEETRIWDDAQLAPFRRSRWFRRGWTLQELIGPGHLVFFAQDWSRIGDRSSLAAPIAAATGIEAALLQHRRRGHVGGADLRGISVAKKMSWAARRQTTRAEDAAYCLLGLFDVNMPLLYGEGGARAFARLQEEIIRTTNDHTVFCWRRARDRGRGRDAGVPSDWSSVLAPSPAAFRDAAGYVPVDAWEAPMPYSMTNLGLSIYLPVVYTLTQLFVVLDAGVVGGREDMRACIAVQRTNQRRYGSNILDRSRFIDGPILLSKEATDTRERYNLFIRSRHILQPGSPHYVSPPPIFKHGVLIFVDPTAKRLLSTGKRDAPLGAFGYDIETHPPGIFDEHTSVLRLPTFEGGSSLLTSGLLRIRFKSPQATDIYLFFAVVLTPGGREVWRCGAHIAEDFWHIRLAIQEHVDEGGSPVPEDVLIHNCLRNEAWESRRKVLTAHTSDESLFVSVGGSMALYPGTDVRAAMVSGKSESPYSVPVSAADISYVDDEMDDEDYVDDTEDGEFEDWDSSNEEEETKERDDAAIGGESKRLRRWDVNSSMEDSQALSSTP